MTEILECRVPIWAPDANVNSMSSETDAVRVFGIPIGLLLVVRFSVISSGFASVFGQIFPFDISSIVHLKDRLFVSGICFFALGSEMSAP